MSTFLLRFKGMELARLATVNCRRSLVILLLLAVSFYGVATLRCYVCEDARSNDDCNKNGPSDCQPSRDTCQTMVGYSDTSQKLSINKICTKNLSCSLHVNETSDACYDGQTISTGTSTCTTCCYEDACNVSRAPSICTSSLASTSTSLLASVVIVVVIRITHSLDDVYLP